MENNKEAIRINKYLALSGFCSRRAADEYVAQGVVAIDGAKATNGSKVIPGQVVTVNGTEIKPNEDYRIYAFYKPVGYISSLSDEQGPGIGRFLPGDIRLFPVGRLDKDSEGLMLLTNDGDLMNSILKASNGHEKEYVVTTEQPVTYDFLNKMEKGVPITNGATGKKVITAPCKTRKISDCQFGITIIQGLNRQIRRMCGYFNYKVIGLKRIRIMNISVSGLKEGELRELSESEISELRKMLEQR